MDAADFDDLSSELVDSYLLFLRGRGPEPDTSGLSSDQRRRLRDQFAIVSALADRAPALPPLQNDPVAVRLGLVEPAAGFGADSRAGRRPGSTATGGDPVAAALRQLELRFDGQVVVDRSPAWAQWQSEQWQSEQSQSEQWQSEQSLSAVAQCSALGSSVALFSTPLGPLAGEPSAVAVFLRRYPDISAVCLSSPDARDAALLTAADANASLDPVRGWLEPGVHTAPDSLEVTLGRYFESRLPRWERVAALTDLIDLGDVSADAVAVAATTLASARRARPRLQHRRAAVAALKALDPSSIGDVVADVQAGRLSGNALVSRLSALAEAVAS
ncbi:hypothetical protein [Jatrophihabitans sp.]|jgi:hypothetical protein|uniref:hypothetical protein n=1 Tax=Jatrophihabitans sp. TaxID=1932789 RepID=UPI002EFBC2D3